MSKAMLPCFKCGNALENAVINEPNQPYAGTEFRTYGHYGSTFFDPFDDSELVLNVCDECLSAFSDRLGWKPANGQVRPYQS